MSAWTMCPGCTRQRSLRKDGRFRVHRWLGEECPGSGRTVAELLRREVPPC